MRARRKATNWVTKEVGLNMAAMILRQPVSVCGRAFDN
jgi:hypothetical protein